MIDDEPLPRLLAGGPSQVFVLESQQETSPKALTELFSPESLSQFSLGDLFAHLEFGGDSNDERAP